jgi:hypothetical protein
MLFLPRARALAREGKHGELPVRAPTDIAESMSWILAIQKDWGTARVKKGSYPRGYRQCQTSSPTGFVSRQWCSESSRSVLNS